MSENILIVDDEQDVWICSPTIFKRAGFKTSVAPMGPPRFKKRGTPFPPCLLDLMLPEIEGTEVCKQLRADPKTAAIPILMLTAKAEEVDRIVGLELGADDYVTKPFSPREVVLRIKKLLARTQGKSGPAELLKSGDLVVDVAKHQVAIKGKEVELTATEFRLLAMLMERRGRVRPGIGS